MSTRVYPGLTAVPPRKGKGKQTVIAKGRFEKVSGSRVEIMDVMVWKTRPGFKYSVGKFSIRPVPLDTTLRSKRSGREITAIRTRYVSVAQSWQDLDEKGRRLGGFTTGGEADMWLEGWEKEYLKLKAKGFSEK